MEIKDLEMASKPDVKTDGEANVCYVDKMENAISATRLEAPGLPNFSLVVNNSFSNSMSLASSFRRLNTCCVIPSTEA
jgi:hypothetical protein